MAIKKRLDLILVEKGLVQSRRKGQALIMAGQILVNDQPVDKPGTLISDQAQIAVKGEPLKYVSRGGLKLEAAIEFFHLDVVGKVCMDVGASTGGFTDCLLQCGAAHVYAIDVGYGQFSWKLRQDPRVTVIERTNIRYMPTDRIDRLVDVVTIDVSFISLKIVIPKIIEILSSWDHTNARIVTLIKPQFEVGKGKVGKGGVVRDENLHTQVIDELTRFFQQLGLTCEPPITSPILGPKGNREFITLLSFTDYGL
jgi:23S rRNA (cytidine1920-2'-O)/16S rRNA (cytidine1409-2'-O)-methyltransferase